MYANMNTNINIMQTIIDESDSQLQEFDHALAPLVRACIEGVEGRLHAKPPIVLFGKVCHQQRDVGFFSDVAEGYVYSRQRMPAQPMTPHLAQLLAEVNALLDTPFNAILINRYNDASDYISAHSDDEKQLAPHSVVASISYGGERIFRIRNKKTKEIVVDVRTADTKGIVMRGQFQKLFTHEIPKDRSYVDVRYSFTFRQHIAY